MIIRFCQVIGRKIYLIPRHFVFNVVFHIHIVVSQIQIVIGRHFIQIFQMRRIVENIINGDPLGQRQRREMAVSCCSQTCVQLLGQFFRSASGGATQDNYAIVIFSGMFLQLMQHLFAVFIEFCLPVKNKERGQSDTDTQNHRRYKSDP